VIHSRLWKAVYLVGNSAHFPLLVQGACAFTGVPYTQTVVEWCATRPAILDALDMTEGTALDDVLRDFAIDPGIAPHMDQLIITAVQQWKDQNHGS